MTGDTVVLKFKGFENRSTLDAVVTAEFGGVGIEDEAVGSGRDIDGIVGE